jgi:hypothetical protein
VLSVRPKITELSFHLFARSVHPELFEVCATRSYVRDQYDLRLSITTDGHLIRFQHAGHILVEVSAGALHPLPKKQKLLCHPIDRVADNVTHYEDVITHQSKVQLEAVNPNMFVTIQQQLGQKLECEGLLHRFESNGRIAFGALSYMNVQSFQKHVLIRSLHTFPDTCAVMTSESRFSIAG